MGEVTLEAERLTKWYGNIIGINDVNMRIGGGIHGLLGVNGSGKSTLIKIITGMMRQSKGSIRVLGEEPWDNPRLRRRIGYCPEGPSMYDELTGEEFLLRKALYHGLSMSEALAEVKRIAEEVELTDFVARKLKGYSRGMRQRLKFANALLLDPELLVLDEPLNGTDPFARLRMMEVIRERARGGAHVLFASHILFEVEELTENVIVLHKGTLLAEGRIWEIRALMDKVPLKIFFRTDQPYELSEALLAFQEVEGIFKHPSGVVAHVRRPLEFYPKFQRYILEERPGVEEFYPLDESLENLFTYLLKGAGT